MNETLGKLHFWLFLIGFHLTFGLMHIPGLLGMPRRIYTYEPGRGWDTVNLLISVGGFIQAIAVVIFVANLVVSYFKGKKAGNDPWDAWTLEWATSSPPPAYNFASIPVVASRQGAPPSAQPDRNAVRGRGTRARVERSARPGGAISTVPDASVPSKRVQRSNPTPASR